MEGDVTERWFPPPWSVDELEACFTITAMVNAEDQPLY
jgi:hypothetical protein